MQEAQRKAIDKNMTDLCDAIHPDLFFQDLRMKSLLFQRERDIISKESTDVLKVQKSFFFLVSKPSAWQATIDYLEFYGLIPNTVKELKLQGGYPEHSEVDKPREIPQIFASSSCLDYSQFKRYVVDYYLGDYRVVDSLNDHTDSVFIERVWLHPQIKRDEKPISDYKDIFFHMKEANCRMAFIMGQPRNGKTAFVKKIAYDWAKNQRCRGWRNKFNRLSNRSHFDLILVIPVRDAEPKDDLLEMAVAFYLGANYDSEAEQICATLRHEETSILIILDGLDTPDVWLPKCLNSTTPIKRDLDCITLMVTSIPGACDSIRKGFAHVGYDIVGPTKEQQNELAERICRSSSPKLWMETFFSHLTESSKCLFLLSVVCSFAMLFCFNSIYY